MAGLQVGLVVKAKCELRFAEFFVESGVEQRACTVAGLLRRLADKDDRASPLILQFRECARYPDEHCHVRVMSARVHHRNFFAFFGFRRDRAGVRQTRLFVDGQCIQIGPHKHGRACAILHHAHHPIAFPAQVIVFAEVLRDVAPSCTQFFGDNSGASLLFCGKLWMAVEVLVNREERRQFRISKRWRCLLR